VLEGMRKGEQIGASLEAKLAIHADPAIVARYQPTASELRRRHPPQGPG
jgi:isoleucyl-tRNA synthetase